MMNGNTRKTQHLNYSSLISTFVTLLNPAEDILRFTLKNITKKKHVILENYYKIMHGLYTKVLLLIRCQKWMFATCIKLICHLKQNNIDDKGFKIQSVRYYANEKGK